MIGDTPSTLPSSFLVEVKKKLDKIELYQDTVNSLVARVEATLTASQAALYERVSEIAVNIGSLHMVDADLETMRHTIVRMEKENAARLTEVINETKVLRDKIIDIHYSPRKIAAMTTLLVFNSAILITTVVVLTLHVLMSAL